MKPFFPICKNIYHASLCISQSCRYRLSPTIWDFLMSLPSVAISNARRESLPPSGATACSIMLSVAWNAYFDADLRAFIRLLLSWMRFLSIRPSFIKL